MPEKDPFSRNFSQENQPEQSSPEEVLPGEDLSYKVESIPEKEGDKEKLVNVRKELEEASTNEKEETFRQEPNQEVEKQGVLKKIGAYFGSFFGEKIFKSVEKKIDNLNIETSGIENIQELKDNPYVMVANHIKPENLAMQVLGMSTDAFILRRAVSENTDNKLSVIANVTGRISKIPILKYLDRLISPLREGILESIGFIPVRKPGKYNRNFIRVAEQRIKEGKPVLIFPEGHWYKDFDPSRRLKDGAAFLAERNNLPIVPVYIRGGRSWSGGEVEVKIGKSFNPEKKTREEITEEIRKSIALLQEQEKEK